MLLEFSSALSSNFWLLTSRSQLFISSFIKKRIISDSVRTQDMNVSVSLMANKSIDEKCQ